MAFFPFASLDDNLSDAGDLISVEAFQQIAQNCNYLIDSMPVGSIVPIMVGFGTTPTPDPNLWQECNGTIITNQASSLRNQPTPNYSDIGGRYMRGYVNIGTIGNYGGSNTKLLIHNHGGTQVRHEELRGDTDDDYVSVGDHMHSMELDLTTDINFEPVHLRIKHYIKIA